MLEVIGCSLRFRRCIVQLSSGSRDYTSIQRLQHDL